jgi:uncharacterized phage-associated protein
MNVLSIDGLVSRADFSGTVLTVRSPVCVKFLYFGHIFVTMGVVTKRNWKARTMRYDAEKVTEAAALLLTLRGGRMHYIKLLKLLYIADREALSEWGIPVSHDNYVSMDNGPVMSQTYNLVKEGGRVWSEFISAPFGDYEVQLTGEQPNSKKLSRAEENILRRVFDNYGHKNRWDLVDYVHTFPEWRDPHGSCIPIDVEEILQALNEPPESIRAIVAELENERKVEKRFEVCV